MPRKTKENGQITGTESEALPSGKSVLTEALETRSPEGLAREVDDLRERLAQTERERNVYQRLSMNAEANELLLRRKLSSYVDQEMTALKKRNEDLENRDLGARLAEQGTAPPDEEDKGG